MKIWTTLGVTLGALLASGCASYPTSTLEQGASASGLYFRTRAGATVSVDGIASGSASAFDGKKTFLNVAPGMRRVRVEAAGQTLFDKPVYVGAGAHVGIDAP